MKLARWRSVAPRFIAARKSRSALLVAAIALGAVLLSVVFTLGETMQAGVQRQIREEYGSFNATVMNSTFGPLDPEVVASVTALPQVRWHVPVFTHEVLDISTPVQVYMGVGAFPPGESGLFLATGRYPAAGEVTLTQALADRIGAGIGDAVTLPFPAGDRTFTVAGLVTTTGLPATAYFDLAWLQRELQVPGPNLLLIGLSPGSSATVLAARAMELSPDLFVDRHGDMGPVQARMETFGLLGGILSVGALFTSLYLVLGAFGVTVQERVHELAMLRAIGASRRQVRTLLVGEVLRLGSIGAVAGICTGVGVAGATASAVSRVFGVPVHAIVVPYPALGFVFVATLVTTLVGATGVVRQAAQTAPLAAMRPDAGTQERRRKAGGLAGLVFLAGSVATAAMTWVPGLSGPGLFVVVVLAAALALLGVLTGLRRLLPWTTALCARLIGRRYRTESTIAQRNLARQPDRSTRLAGMLVLGIAFLIMLASVTQSENRDWKRNLPLWFPTEGNISAAWGIKVGYHDDVVERLASLPGVEAVYPRGAEFDADLVGYDEQRMSQQRRNTAQLRREPPGRVIVEFTDTSRLATVWQFGQTDGSLTGGIILSRRLAEDMGMRLGERITLQPVDGGSALSFPVVGIVENAPGGAGLVVDRALMPDSVPQHYRVGLVKVAASADRQHVRDAVNAVLADGYAAFSYEDLGDIIAWTEQNSRQSRLMVAMAGLVMVVAAATGFANVVTAALHERRRELAMMRAVGAKSRQLLRLLTVEAVVLGMAGSVLGVATGVLMTMLYALPSIRAGSGPVVPLEVIVPALVAGPVLAVVATVGPVRALSKQPLMEALKAG